MNILPSMSGQVSPAPIRPQASASHTLPRSLVRLGGPSALLLILSLSACGDMSRRGTDTAVGAGAGAVVTGGSAVGTVGGAVVGGVIGDSVGKK
jgi:osmotically inducible lipoprotein OsmB